MERRLKKHDYPSMSPTAVRFIAQIKRLKNLGVLGTRCPRHKGQKGTHVPLALGQTNVPSLYYLWAALDILRTAVDMKQLINTQSKAFSSEPDADYRCHQTQALIAHTPSFDATSCLHWSRRLRSAGMAIVIGPRGESLGGRRRDIRSA